MEVGLTARSVDLLFSLSLKPSIMAAGKVWPFSQMSTSFLILSCLYVKGPVSFRSTDRFLEVSMSQITRSRVASLQLCEPSQVCLLQGDGNVEAIRW